MSSPESAAPSVEERIAIIESLLNDKATAHRWYAGVTHRQVQWLIAELRARDEALRDARNAATGKLVAVESIENANGLVKATVLLSDWIPGRPMLQIGATYSVTLIAPYSPSLLTKPATDGDTLEMFDASTSLARTEGGDVGPDGTGASR